MGCNYIAVRYTTKLRDGTIFENKGYKGEEPSKFEVDEGNVRTLNNFVFLRYRN